MDLLAYLGYAIPVCIPLGYYFARSGQLKGRHYYLLTAIILNLLLPVFMFFALSQSALAWRSSGVMAVAALLIPVCCSLATYPLARWRGVAARERVLPVSFPNTGNLGIPLATLLFGRAGLELSVVFALVVGVLHYSYGVTLVSARGSVRRGIISMLKLPIFGASLAGILCNGASFTPTLSALLTLLAFPALPGMLFLLGASLHNTCLTCYREAAWWAGWKYLVSFAGAGLLIVLTGVRGVTAGLLLVNAGLPSAVATIILARRFAADQEFATAMIALTTLLALVIIPVVYLLVRAAGLV